MHLSRQGAVVVIEPSNGVAWQDRSWVNMIKAQRVESLMTSVPAFKLKKNSYSQRSTYMLYRINDLHSRPSYKYASFAKFCKIVLRKRCAPIAPISTIYAIVLSIVLLGCAATSNCVADSPTDADMAGYLLVPHEKVPDKYNAGFSLYVAAWPLLTEYPGNRFQTGLFGTWMHAQYDSPEPERKLYSDIEGGLGWWRDTRFATETPKFIMGGVALNFSEWANGPGAGKGRDWEQPKGKYAVAQLSPWVLWPPDGLNLKQGTCGELFGYGYLPLPLTSPKSTTAGSDVPTGDNCWTLFLNTGNFKGPVAFFTPYFWSRASAEDPSLSGLFLDSRPSKPNKALQMETQYVPAYQSTDSDGVNYARIAPTSFPRNATGDSPVVHRITAYEKSALWESVRTWFDGGPPASGAIDARAAAVHTFADKGGSTWRIYPPGTPKEQKVPLTWNAFATPIALDPVTYGYRWNHELVTQSQSASEALSTLPQYFRLEQSENGQSQWVPVLPQDVPAETGLAKVDFHRPLANRSEAYVTPDDSESSWKQPGPVAGPFETKLGDGSIVTYYWYRFADKLAIVREIGVEKIGDALKLVYFPKAPVSGRSSPW